MKKSRWTDYRNRAYRPVRYLELVKGTVALVQAEEDDHWRVFATWNNGLVEKSQTFLSVSMSQKAFEEICAELSRGEKDILVEELSETDVKPTYLAECAQELARLEIANDEKYDGLVAKADRFTASHSPEECEQYIRAETTRYEAMRGEEKSCE